MENKDDIRAEIVKCGREPWHFIKSYVKIRHPKRGLIPFALWDYQEDLLHDYVGNRFNVVLKARQLGISEVTAAFCLWMMLFHRQKSILIVATKADTAKNMIRKVQTAMRYLPKWLMLADVITDNKMSVELSNGSFIKAVAKSKDVGRSEALSLLVIDEAAHIEDLETLWTGLMPTVAAGGRVVVMSTPLGVGNKFHQVYTDAESGNNEFKPTKLMWWVHPEHLTDLEDDPYRPGFKSSSWYRQEIKQDNMSARDIAQELECNFNASGETVIGAEILEWIAKDCVWLPTSREGVAGAVHVWEGAITGAGYLVVCDVARGDGKDNSTAHVFRLDGEFRQVAEYCGKTPPDMFAKLITDLGIRYNKALLVIEMNSVGLACIEHVKLIGYPNLFYYRKDARAGETIGEGVSTEYGPASSDLIPGFTTSGKTRPLVVNKLEEYLRNRQMLIRSMRLLQELRTFVWISGRPEAMSKFNDDLVMAAAIAAYIRDTVLSSQFATSEVTEAMLAAMSTTKRVHTEIEGAAKDPRFVSQRQLGVFGQTQKDPYTMTMPNGEEMPLGWLISRG